MGRKKPTHGTFQQAKRPHLALVFFFFFVAVIPGGYRKGIMGEKKAKKKKKKKNCRFFMPYNALSCGHYSGLSSPRLRLTSPHMGPYSSSGHGLGF
jgi:hypothetical protein